MATIKSSDTRVVVEELATQLLDLLHNGNETATDVSALAGYISGGGAVVDPEDSATYNITDSKVTQTLELAGVDGLQSTSYTLTGTKLKDAALANATKLVVSHSETEELADDVTASTSVNKSTETSTLKVNPYNPAQLDVTQVALAGQYTGTQTDADGSLKTVGTASGKFAGLQQYGLNDDNELALQTITIKAFDYTFKGTQSGAYFGTKLTGSFLENFGVQSKSGLTYDNSTGVLSGALDSLTYASTQLTKLQGFSDGYEHRYNATAFTAQMLEALANAAANDTPELRKAALLGGDDTITGSSLDGNYLEGGAGNDRITGTVGDDTLYGDEGDDVLDGGAGSNWLIGGAGDDTYVINSAEDLAGINTDGTQTFSDAGSDTLRITYKGGTVVAPVTVSLAASNLAAVENVQLAGTGVFNVIGNALANILDAGKTASILSGGSGSDTYYVNVKGTTVVEAAAAGTDTVIAAITYALGANVENLTLTGKAALNGTGNAQANVLIGNDGANILDGGAGADSLAGGKGNDTYIVDRVDDVVTEALNEGIDTVKSSVSFTLGVNLENLTLTGTAQTSLYGTGNALNNTLTGDAGNNHLDGRAGVDKLIGGAGNDTYSVDLIAKGAGAKATVALQDSIVESKGGGDDDRLVLRLSADTETQLAGATKATTLTLANYLEHLDASGTGALKLNLTGNTASNRLTGNDADNVINGGTGNDFIDGGDGNDLIIGGLGVDTLTGGNGNDTFSFASLKDLGLGANQDVITDFTVGEDTLNFKGFKGWSFDAAATEATGAKQLWAVVQGNDTIVYGNSGGTLAEDFSIKLLGVTNLAAGDIVFG
jgi:Ca2+-binding RTX toxin-like protein